MADWCLKNSYIHREVPDLPDDYGRSIEMSGRYASVITRYGKSHPALTIFFPYYHTGLGPRDSLCHNVTPNLSIELATGEDINLEHVKDVAFDGIFTANLEPVYPISASVQIFPSTQKPAVFGLYTLANLSNSKLRGRVRLKAEEDKVIEAVEGTITVSQRLALRNNLSDRIDFELEAGTSLEFGYVIQVSTNKPQIFDLKAELEARRGLIELTSSRAELATEHSELDFMYRLSKLRAVESVFDTQIGPMHSPEGGEYYGGIWCNDQAEYAFPLFPYLGINNDVAIHDYALFARYKFESGQYPYSIESAGNFIGKLERGDGAMYAYGASLFLLGMGSKEAVNRLLPFIEECIEFELGQMDANGVIRSTSDELETRFPSGDANLATSSLFYGALIKAAAIENLAGEPEKAHFYLKTAAQLRESIENHFGTEIEGYNTYKYYEGNDHLRGWICYPLNVGIYDRAPGTRDALLSDKLWSQYGLRVVSGNDTVWQRETLYAIRGLFLSGFADDAAVKLLEMSHSYTSGDSAPYMTEISPSYKQLAAESALFGRIITEGLFGISPMFDKLVIKPNLPKDWQFAKLRNVKLLSRDLSLELKQDSLHCEIDGETVFDGTLPDNGIIITVKNA